MKKLLKAFAVFAALAMLGSSFVACSSGGDDDDNGGSEQSQKYKCPGCQTEYDTEDEKNNCAKQEGCAKYEEPGTPVENGFSFSGYKWNLNDATAEVSADGKVLTVTPTKGGASLVMDSSELAAIYEKYPEGFAVTAVIRPTAFGSSKGGLWTSNEGPDLGVASHFSDNAFYDFTLNWNGRTQLGTKASAKGVQFGSLITDNSGTIFKAKVLDEPYVLRMEYSEGKIKGFVNGIAQAKSGVPTMSVTGATRSATEGSYAIVNGQGDTFELYSFAVTGLNEGKAAILLKTNNEDLSVLSDGASTPTKYVFFDKVAYETRIGKDATTFTVKAFANDGSDVEATIENSNNDAVTAELTDGVISITPKAVGTSVVTVKAGEVIRTISVKVLEALGYADTEYDASAMFPANEATGVYEDERLVLTFDEPPVLGEGDVEIFAESDLEKSAAKVSVNAGTSYEISDGTNKQLYTLKFFNVQIDGNKLVIVPPEGKLANNTKYVVGIANGVITGKIGGKDFTGFDPAKKRWSFTTRESKPAASSTITVGSSATANYRSIQSALKATTGDATIEVEKGTYHEVLFYKKANSIKIVGKGEAEFGTDVVIRGINCNEYNGSTATRAVFSFQGTNLVMENVTLQNAMDRNTMISGNSSQSEALYFNGTYCAAYNSSFKGFQDTLLLNKGRSWFYKCYVDGDTDFIWGSSDAALFEECKIVQLDTSKDKKPASGSYIFETRVSNEANSTVGKGYVLFNTELQSKHASSYLGRRASGAGAAGTNYYDQMAFINVKLTDGSLKGGFSVGNRPIFIAKADGNQHVGIKVYGCTPANLGLTFNTDWEGTITEAVYNKEYNGRNTILNRVYKKADGSYVNNDTVWNISALETEFKATADNSSIDDTSNVVNYDFSVNDPTSTTGLTSTSVSWNKSTYALGNGGAKIEMPVTGKGTVTVKYCYGADAKVYIDGQKAKAIRTSSNSTTVIEEVEYKNGAGAGTIVIEYLGTTYLTGIKFEADDSVTAETGTVTSVTVSGDKKVAKDENITLKATVVSTYVEDESVAWSSSDENIAKVDANTGKVTGVAAGNVTITATNKLDTSKKDDYEIEVTATAAVAEANKVYTWNFVGLSATPTSVADKEENGLNVKVGGAPTNNANYGLYNTDATYTFPVAGEATVIAYISYVNGSATLSLETEAGTKVGSDKSVTKTDAILYGSGDHKPANGPIAYTWHYKGEATNLVLKVPAKLYIAQIVADNTVTTEGLTACTYDFTAATMATPMAPSAGNNKMFWYGTENGAYKSAQYGIQAMGNLYLAFYVGGASKVTIHESYAVAGLAYLLKSDGTAVPMSTAEDAKLDVGDYTFDIAEAGTYTICIPKNGYLSSIDVAAAD